MRRIPEHQLERKIYQRTDADCHISLVTNARQVHMDAPVRTHFESRGSWDVENKRWFDLHPHERLTHTDWNHWTQPANTWNLMCAECHSTDVQRNYHQATDTYDTRYANINVGCESCHGPGSVHVDLASSLSLFWDRNLGYGLTQSVENLRLHEVDQCAQCHSAREQIAGGFRAGNQFLDHFQPALIDAVHYHLDGQILGDVYEYGSFRQSRMFHENVRCSDCHNPHSLELRLPGNQLCVRCHTPDKGDYDSPAHHHHKADSAGASCVACHMPAHNYLEVDTRHDHSLRIPRPDLTVKLGLPNACGSCHDKPEETAQWAADAVAAWYGPNRRAEPHYGETLTAGFQADPAALESLMVLAGVPVAAVADAENAADATQATNAEQAAAANAAGEVGDFVRASAMAMLGRYPQPQIEAAALAALADPAPLVRTAALRLLGPSTDELEVRRAEMIRDRVVPLLDDPVRLVRFAAAEAMTQIPRRLLDAQQRTRLDGVINELREGLLATNDDPRAHLLLGRLYLNQGQRAQARTEYLTAMRQQPPPDLAVETRLQLAVLQQLEGDDADAEALYREVVELAQANVAADEARQQQAEPTERALLELRLQSQRQALAKAYYSLGLLLAGDFSRTTEAAQMLGAAVAIEPESARKHYNHAIMLQKGGQADEAIAALRRACQLEPTSTQYLAALTILQMQRRDWGAALQSAQRLSELDSSQQQLLLQVLREVPPTQHQLPVLLP